MTRRFLGSLSVLALLLSGGCSSEEPTAEVVIRPVRSLEVFASGGSRARSFSGTAEAGMESRLSFKVAGTIEALNVAVGDQVRAGAPIARLDATDLELALQDADAAVDRALAEERRAKASLTRARQLYENRTGSQADLDAARAASESAAASVRSAQKSLELARSQRGYAQLSAPVNGAISAVPMEVGENVGVGQTVAVLTSGTRPEVQVLVPEALIGAIREGDNATATFDALREQQFRATITEVGVAASSAGATFPVRVRLINEAPDVRPGMAAEVTFNFATPGGADRIYVPAAAVMEDRDGRFAYVLDADDGEPGFATTRRVEVSVGELDERGLHIVNGLRDGDRIVTAGVTKIQNGLRVRVPELVAK